jgi:hypothetical protein
LCFPLFFLGIKSCTFTSYQDKNYSHVNNPWVCSCYFLRGGGEGAILTGPSPIFWNIRYLFRPQVAT